jgi:hypothetical protein
MVIGYFTSKERTELINKKCLKNFINFQKKYPSAVILSLDYNMTKNGLYDLACYRLNKNLMDLVDLIEIEEDEPNILKKYTTSENLLTRLNFKIKKDIFTIVSKFTEKQEKEVIEKLPQNIDKVNMFKRM